MSTPATRRVHLNLLILAVIFSLPGGVARAEPPSMLSGASPEQEAIYLAGVASGIGYANAHATVTGKSPLYCPPNDYVLNVKEMRRIAELSLTGPVEPHFYALAAVDWLSENFPCEM